MHPTYRHVQVGWVTLGVSTVLFVLVAATSGLKAIYGPFFPMVLFAAIPLLFGWLTVSVDEQRLRARFGIGLVRTTIALAQVESISAVRNPWIWGWGIRFFPGGVLYNVSGLDAVELRLKDGRRRRIGTDEPHALESALRAHLADLPPAR